MLRASVAAVALTFAALPAQAATFLSFDGSTGVFGNTLVDSPTFEDMIDLGPLTPGAFLISATISSTYEDANQADQNVDFISVMLNGVEFEIGNTGQNEFRFINSVASGSSNLFTIRGSGGINSSYSGTVNVAEVPEPATWAMLLAGFTAIGGALRRRPLGRSPLPQLV